MGDLGSQYGFFGHSASGHCCLLRGEDPGMGGAGEAVTLVDGTGEAWVFHICGGVPSNKSKPTWAGQRGALWAAQRVPAGHVAVVANSRWPKRSLKPLLPRYDHPGGELDG